MKPSDQPNLKCQLNQLFLFPSCNMSGEKTNWATAYKSAHTTLIQNCIIQNKL